MYIEQPIDMMTNSATLSHRFSVALCSSEPNRGAAARSSSFIDCSSMPHTNMKPRRMNPLGWAASVASVASVVASAAVAAGGGDRR